MGTLGGKYKLWWSGNDAEFEEIGILEKEEISRNIVKVKKRDKVMATVLTLGREVMQIVRAYGQQQRRSDAYKVRFYDKMASECDLGSFSKIIVSWCMANTWFYKTNKTKIIDSAGGCETAIHFVLVGKKYKKFIRAVKVIPWKLQHKLVIVDLAKKFLKKVVKKQ